MPLVSMMGFRLPRGGRIPASVKGEPHSGHRVTVPTDPPTSYPHLPHAGYPFPPRRAKMMSNAPNRSGMRRTKITMMLKVMGFDEEDTARLSE